MATKQATNKKTNAISVENNTPAPVARVSKPAAKSAKQPATTSRVRTVKHSKAVVTAASPEEILVATPVATLSHEVVARTAYGYWADRGYRDGSPAEDWFRAEAECRQLLAV